MESRYHTITITITLVSGGEVWDLAITITITITGGEVWDLARRLVVSPFPLALISSGNFFSVLLLRCVTNFPK